MIRWIRKNARTPYVHNTRTPFRSGGFAESNARRRSLGDLFVISLILLAGTLFLLACAPKYSRYDPDQKQALRTLAGGVAGVLIAGNTGGAIVGAFVADVASVATIKYEDRLLENGDQAAKRYLDQEKKAEERKEQERKAEELREQERKADERKRREEKAEEPKEREKKAEEATPEEQKAEEEKLREKKAAEEREAEKKAEKRLRDKRVKLIIEDSSLASHTVVTGSVVKAVVRYTVLAPEGTEKVTLTETRRLWTAYTVIEIDTRDVVRESGTYQSTIQFKLPEDLPRGYCVLYTTVSDGRQIKTARSVMNVL